jgi:predicted DNA-binding ribbon-helix-helix protein
MARLKRPRTYQRGKTKIQETVHQHAVEIIRQYGEYRKNLITSIDANRQSANLSSALRIFVLRHYMDQSRTVELKNRLQYSVADPR